MSPPKVKRCGFVDANGTECIAPKATNEKGKQVSEWCDPHTHDWIAAAEIPLPPARIAGIVRRSPYEVPESTWVRLVEVLCSSCRVTYAVGVNTPCDSYSTLLRGGPMGTRRRKGDPEDALSSAERLS